MVINDLGLVNGPEGLAVVGIEAKVTLADSTGKVVLAPELRLADENELAQLSEVLRPFWNHKGGRARVQS